MKRLFCTLALAGLMTISCQVSPPADQSVVHSDSKNDTGASAIQFDQSSAKLKNKVAADNNAFAFDLYAKLRDKKGNLFFSPGSISTALAMTYAGAEGNTAAEMALVMHFKQSEAKLHPAFAALLHEMNGSGIDPAKRGYQLTVANALWGQAGYPWIASFLNTTKTNYNAGFHDVDFGDEPSTRRTINSWVANETHGKIKDLIPNGLLNSYTRLVLTNAIYFKGDWLRKFDKAGTQDQKFYLTAYMDKQTPMMQRTDTYRHAATDKLQMLELPYKGKDLSMFVLLPTEREGIHELEKSLSAAKFDEYLKLSRPTEIEVILPKFKFEKTVPLAETLQQMGMTTAFDRGKANFKGMAAVSSEPEDNLYIYTVLHKAFVEVNEEGAEAAAATAVVSGIPGASFKPQPPPPPVFRADHPFMFVIRDNRNGSILFMGRVVDPSVN